MAVNIDEMVSRKGSKAPPPAADEGETGDVAAAEEGGEDSYASVEGDALDALAKTLGVKDRAAFGEALHDFVEACVKRHMGGKE